MGLGLEFLMRARATKLKKNGKKNPGEIGSS
jgi:hypothetical protein